MQIADTWLRDLPQQFQGKHNIEVLIKAFSKQMQEVDRVFQDLNTMTDLDTATGQNLDYVGTIIPLTRKEAGELAGIGVTDPVISDDRYRQFLRYQNLVNTNECTYQDLINGIELMWRYKGIHYIEDPKRPATIIFQTDRMDLDDEDLVEFYPELCIRPAGVGVILRKYFGGFYEVSVRYSECIRFLTGFYPRFNQERLKLNRIWKLNGGRKLNGYKSRETIDLYPMSARFRTAAEGALEEEVRVHLLAGAGEKEWVRSQAVILIRESTDCSSGADQRVAIKTQAAEAWGEETQVRLRAYAQERVEDGERLQISSSVACKTAIGERQAVRTSAAVTVEAGEIRVYNKNRLDSGFRLNGRRKLNGGTELR